MHSNALDSLTYVVLTTGLVRVTKRSPMNGKLNTMDLPITADELVIFAEDGGKTDIQNLLPTCNADQREFLKTGYTPDDWKKIFPPEKSKT